MKRPPGPVRWIALFALAATAAGCGARWEVSGRRAAQVVETFEPGATIAPDAVAAPSGQSGARQVTTKGTSRTVGQRGQQVALKAGEPIRVGGLFPLSEGLSALGTPAMRGARAWFRHLNASGGIDGRKVEFRPCDDKAEDARSTACAKKLVDQDKVFVMGPSFTPFSISVIDELERAGVPWIGYDGINVEGFSKSNVITIGASIEPMAHVMLPYWLDWVAKRAGATPRKIGAIVLDVPPALTYVREAEQVICPKIGCQIAYKRLVTYTTLDYGSILADMQQQRVEGIWIVTDPASAVKVLTYATNLNYKPQPGGFFGQHGIYLDITTEQANASGIYNDMLANSALLPPTADAPATREMRQIIERYEPGTSLGYFTALAYASARLTEDVIRQALRAGGDLTRARTLAAAGAFSNYDCHGLCKDVALSTPPNRSGGNHNIWVVRAKGKSWVVEAGPIDTWRQPSWPRPGRP